MKRVSTYYSYFGARYYDSDLSVWLSVDPLAKEYPSLSPYMYVAGNPVKLVDPDGNRIYLRGSRENKIALRDMINSNTTGVTVSVGFFSGALKVKQNGNTLTTFDKMLLETYNNKDVKVNAKVNSNNFSKTDGKWSNGDKFAWGNFDEMTFDINGLTLANNEDPVLFKLLFTEAVFGTKEKKNLEKSIGGQRKVMASIWNESNGENGHDSRTIDVIFKKDDERDVVPLQIIVPTSSRNSEGAIILRQYLVKQQNRKIISIELN